MKIKLPYGIHKTAALDIDEDDLLYHHRAESVPHLTSEEILKRTKQALDEPLGFVPLRYALVPGDHVVIPVMPETPQVTLVLRGVLEYLLEMRESRPGKITVLRAERDSWTLDGLEQQDERISFVTLETDKAEQFAMLAVSETDDPLTVARLLFDADFVLPVGSFFPECSPGYFGIHSPIYPLFSNAETQKRYRSFPHDKQKNKHAKRSPEAEIMERELDLVTRQLGVTLMLNVLPSVPAGTALEDWEDDLEDDEAPAESGETRQPEMAGTTGVADVIAGEYRELQREVYPRYRELWTLQERCLAGVVIATVHGGAEMQTWANVFRAAMSASTLTSEGGTIVVCSDVTEPFPTVLEALRQVRNVDQVLKHAQLPNVEDAAAALGFLRVLKNFHVAFLSALDGERLEELGIMPLEDAGELNRLVESADSCVILPNAHRVIL